MASPDHVILESAGGELITNGQFTSDISGWTDASTGLGSIAWVDGTMRLYAGGSVPGNDAAARQSISTAIGTEYTFSFDIVAGTGATGEGVLVYIGTTAGGFEVVLHSYASVGTHTFTFTATATTTYVQFRVADGATVPRKYIDNVSCRSEDAGTNYINLEDGSGHIILESSDASSHVTVIADGTFIYFRRRRR